VAPRQVGLWIAFGAVAAAAALRLVQVLRRRSEQEREAEISGSQPR
jgi:hypothetical protein